MNEYPSGAVILARLRPEYSPPDRPPEVHAYRVDHVVWVAPCGDTVRPGEVEIVKSFTGSQCPQCWMFAALASDAPMVSRAELETAPPPELPAAFLYTLLTCCEYAVGRFRAHVCPTRLITVCPTSKEWDGRVTATPNGCQAFAPVAPACSSPDRDLASLGAPLRGGTPPVDGPWAREEASAKR